MNSKPHGFAIVVHGGAGEPLAFEDGCQQAAAAGLARIAETGDALDAAIAAVLVLEEDERFNAGTGAVLSDTLPASTDTASDEERRKARKDKEVDAVLHASYPVRFWDHDLGVGQTRLLAGDLVDDEAVEWRKQFGGQK